MWARVRSVTLAVAAAAAITGASAMSAGGAPADRVSVADATITAVNGSSLTVKATSGERVVRVGTETLILARETATLGAIKAGDGLAVTAKRGAEGTLTAVSINIFSPELWKHVHKGQFPMESGDVMTNAEVMQYVDRIEGRMLYLKYNEGSTAIIVPAATVIHRLVTVRLGDLKVGMRISVRGLGDPDGTIRATTITLDRTGRA